MYSRGLHGPMTVESGFPLALHFATLYLDENPNSFF
jgi:hypothetical protein